MKIYVNGWRNKYKKSFNSIRKASLPNHSASITDYENIQELVELHTPMKVISDEDGDEICPNCKSRVHDQWQPKHCEDCGQALNWSKD